MDIHNLHKQFERMGARVKVAVRPATNPVTVNIGRDRKGEFFDLAVAGGVDAAVLDVRKPERHLLLCARRTDELGLPLAGTSQRFLCGHDERAWFVAAVPERRAASNVREAMEALKPIEAVRSQAQRGVRFEKRNRRRNAGFVRQGEWFFVPAENVSTWPWDALLRNEPLRRGNGKPHFAEFAFRAGGELVYVRRGDASRVLTAAQYQRRLSNGHVRAADWLPMRRNAAMYVRGRISHPDHATIVLRDWHLVAMNNEHQSVAMRSVAFLD